MNNSDRMVKWPVGFGDDLPERLWADSDYTAAEVSTAGDPTARLATLGFIRSALKRRWRLWCTTAVLGLLAGSGLFFHKPPSYQAATTVLLKDGPNQDPTVQITTDAALAESTTVAAGVVQQLGLRQSPSSFLGTYTVLDPTPAVLAITVSAPTSSQAVQRASIVASQFLKVRAQYAQIQQQQLETSLNQQIVLAKQNLNSITQQVNKESAQPSTTTQQAKLASLQRQEQTVSNTLAQVEQSVTATVVGTRAATQAEVEDSQVIDAATPLKHSLVRSTVLYVGGGLMGGLALGVAVVAIGALVSDRLRRRDDVAYAMLAPVRLSVGPLAAGRWPGLPGRAKAREHDMMRLLTHLGSVLPQGSKGPSSLAIVAVDDAKTAAHTVVTFALRNASEGRRVLLADLSRGTHAGRLLGAGQPGVGKVSSDGAHVMVLVPDPDDMPPIGPLGNKMSPGGNSRVTEAVANAAASADLLISLVTLDPRSGGDHLATWATDAVAVVTAGKSSAMAIRATGEMIRLAGTRLHSVVLIAADKTDESLGASSLEWTAS